jgi:hypothetical protein
VLVTEEDSRMQQFCDGLTSHFGPRSGEIIQRMIDEAGAKEPSVADSWRSIAAAVERLRPQD